jgi:hypothetical protein
MMECDKYKKALREMAKDFIDVMREEARWGDWIEGKWVNYKRPVTEGMLELFISDYVDGTTNFFCGNPPANMLEEPDA